jgi:1-acyl-sn-glycerol-3-phosphate acyltransferase
MPATARAAAGYAQRLAEGGAVRRGLPMWRSVAAETRQRPTIWLRACIVTMYPALVFFFRRDVRHGERLTRPGAAIIVANHVSHVDPVLLASVVWDAGYRPRFLAKASLFTKKVIGRAIRGSGQVPVARGSADARASLQEAVDVLRSGDRILIYPEGTVTRDPEGWPMSGKSGAARLALLMPDVPLIPIGQWGARDSVDVYAKRFRPRPRRHVVYTIGEPIDLTAFASGPPTPETLHKVTELIMSAIRTLTEQSRSAA